MYVCDIKFIPTFSFILISSMTSNIYIFKPSALLDVEENETVRTLIGRRTESLCTGIVQVFKSVKSDKWNLIDSGILCFIKDHVKKSYFFRLFGFNEKRLLWEQEVYVDFKYNSNSFFHMFEADDCIIGFNFASKEEADIFSVIVKQKTVHTPIRTKTQKYKGTIKKKKINKMTISQPSNFSHIAHVGLDNSFNRSEDEFIKGIMEKAGVSNLDSKTKNFAEKFIKKKMRTKRRAPPPPVQTQSNDEIEGAKQVLVNKTNAPPPPPLPNGIIPPPPMPTNAPSASTSIPPPPSMATEATKNVEESTRNNLFNDIKSGTHKLKPVQNRPVRPTAEEDHDFNDNDIASALMIALEKRQQKFTQSDSSSPETEDWSD